MKNCRVCGNKTQYIICGNCANSKELETIAALKSMDKEFNRIERTIKVLRLWFIIFLVAFVVSIFVYLFLFYYFDFKFDMMKPDQYRIDTIRYNFINVMFYAIPAMSLLIPFFKAVLLRSEYFVIPFFKRFSTSYLRFAQEYLRERQEELEKELETGFPAERKWSFEFTKKIEKLER